MEIREQQVIRSAWDAQTSYGGYSIDNPSAGQCAITAIYLSQKYGYELYDMMVGRSRHFFNKDASGAIVDLTAEQFGKDLDYSNAQKRDARDLLKNKELMERYRRFLVNLDENVKYC